MNYREKMRKAIECPQFGNINYGKWGALKLDQRKNIKRLLDEMDRADEVIKHQFFEIEELQQKIDKAIEYIEEAQEKDEDKESCSLYIPKLLKILKGSDKE